MAISKRKGSPYYWTRFQIDGIRVQQSTKCITRTEAKEYEDHLKQQIRRQLRLGEKAPRTWKEAVVRWCKEMTHKKSLETDIYRLRKLRPYLDSLFLHQINKPIIETFIEDKIKEGKTIATINRYLALIKAILSKAKKEWEWLKDVPNIRLKKEANKRLRWLTYEEARKLIQELPEHLAQMARFTLATGLRAANVRLLEWSQIDMHKQHAWVYGDQAKGKKPIAIPLNQDAMEVLSQQIGHHEKYVFPYNGHPVNKCSTRAFRNAVKRSKIKDADDFRWHDLRHTWASWHVQNGTSLMELKELGGWEDKDMVFRYAHLSNDRLKTAADNISGSKMVQRNLKVIDGII
jgi:integrase